MKSALFDTKNEAFGVILCVLFAIYIMVGLVWWVCAQYEYAIALLGGWWWHRELKARHRMRGAKG